MIHQVIYVSATPADYELRESEGVVVEQIIRPTGLLDPVIDVRPSMIAKCPLVPRKTYLCPLQTSPFVSGIPLCSDAARRAYFPLPTHSLRSPLLRVGCRVASDPSFGLVF